MNGRSSQFAILDSHHRGGSATRANAVADGINARQAGLECIVDGDESLVCCELQQRGQRGLLLANSLDDLVRGEYKLRARDRLRRRTAGWVRRSQLYAKALQANGRPSLSSTREGCARKRNSMPSLRAKSYSCS